MLIPADDGDLIDALDSLMVVGMTNPLLVLTGDQGKWKGAGLAIVETPLIKVEDLAHRNLQDTLIQRRQKLDIVAGLGHVLQQGFHGLHAPLICQC